MWGRIIRRDREFYYVEINSTVNNKQFAGKIKAELFKEFDPLTEYFNLFQRDKQLIVKPKPRIELSQEEIANIRDRVLGII